MNMLAKLTNMVSDYFLGIGKTERYTKAESIYREFYYGEKSRKKLKAFKAYKISETILKNLCNLTEGLYVGSHLISGDYSLKQTLLIVGVCELIRIGIHKGLNPLIETNKIERRSYTNHQSLEEITILYNKNRWGDDFEEGDEWKYR